MTKKDMALTIADYGRWEEFHQKRGEFFMYDHYKSLRISLEKQYRATTTWKKVLNNGY